MQHEFGIAVLKPDGNKIKIKEKFISLLELNGIEIIDINTLRLTEKDIRECFAPNAVPIDEYIKYMCSGDVQAILVQGKKVGNKLQKIKKTFREMFGISNAVTANMLHTSDQGVEYFLQFPIFFPHLCVEKYCSNSDMHVVVQNEKLDELIRIEKETNLSYVGLVLKAGQNCNVIKQYNQLSAKLTVFSGVSKPFSHNNLMLDIIGFLPKRFNEITDTTFTHNHLTIHDYIGYIESLGGFLVVDYIPFNEFTEELIKMLSSIGIQGVMTYDPRRTLYETEILEDLIIDAGMVNTGGTNGFASIGSLTLGEYEFEDIKKLFIEN